uniref:Uncharacterized protein n=1 Tax=Timema monikensis TaxID=170555 RepID=A0A7R9ECC9_9NEOP|nr:unnamed protein product [Timema monikensis]
MGDRPLVRRVALRSVDAREIMAATMRRRNSTQRNAPMDGIRKSAELRVLDTVSCRVVLPGLAELVEHSVEPIDIIHRRESLQDDYTLMDVAYIYTWKRVSYNHVAELGRNYLLQ